MNVDPLFDGEHLADRVREAILAAGDAAVPALLEIACDDTLLEERARGGGYAPLHAVQLLGQLRAAEAIPRLIELVCTTDPMDLIRGSACRALEAMGPAALEPCLAAFATANRTARLDLGYALAKLGVRDERVYQALLGYFAEDAEMGAGMLAEYGDARALPLLHRALAECRVKPGINPLANCHVAELRAAIEDLGGTFTDEERRKIERADEPAACLPAPSNAPCSIARRPRRSSFAASGRRRSRAMRLARAAAAASTRSAASQQTRRPLVRAA